MGFSGRRVPSRGDATTGPHCTRTVDLRQLPFVEDTVDAERLLRRAPGVLAVRRRCY